MLHFPPINFSYGEDLFNSRGGVDSTTSSHWEKLYWIGSGGLSKMSWTRQVVRRFTPDSYSNLPLGGDGESREVWKGAVEISR